MITVTLIRSMRDSGRSSKLPPRVWHDDSPARAKQLALELADLHGAKAVLSPCGLEWTVDASEYYSQGNPARTVASGPSRKIDLG